MPYARSGLAVLSLLMLSSIASPAAPEVLRDVEYARADGISLRFDASLPRTPGRAPAVIIVHGGAWVTGDRRLSVQPLFAPLEQAGFAWFSISYRLATNVTQFGAAIDDVQAAVRFVKRNALEYGIEPTRVALGGESAGGQLAAMAALRGDPTSSVRAVVALYTPSDLGSLLKTSDYVPRSIRDSVRGTPWEALLLAGVSQFSPIDNVHAGMPPFLLIHGTDDALVPYGQSTEFCKRIHDVGGACDLFPVQGAGHGLRWWESEPRLASAYKRELVSWLRKRDSV